MKPRIYLDHAATSPMLPEVGDAMATTQSIRLGNPSSLHQEGRVARGLIDDGREKVANAWGCDFSEVLFTSGGSESSSLAILGAAISNKDSRRTRVLLSAAEHHCVLNTTPLLTRLGFQVELVPVDQLGKIDLNALEAAISDDVLLVAVMHANNEVGSWSPIPQVSDLCKAKGALLYVDAVQTLGCETQSGGRWTPESLGADLVGVSAHKIGGPLGIGALYVRPGVRLSPLVAGGGQEREVRPGTENLLGIIGFGKAAELTENRRSPFPQAATVTELLRSELDEDLFSPTIADTVDRHPRILHLIAHGVSAESLVLRMDREGIAIGSGAACSSGSLEPSHVLKAMGWTEEQAKRGIRLSLGPNTTPDEAKAAAKVLNATAAELAV